MHQVSVTWQVKSQTYFLVIYKGSKFNWCLREKRIVYTQAVIVPLYKTLYGSHSNWCPLKAWQKEEISVLGCCRGCASLTERQFSPVVCDICFDQNERLDILIKSKKKWLQWNFCLRHFTWGFWNLWDHREIKEKHNGILRRPYWCTWCLIRVLQT